MIKRSEIAGSVNRVFTALCVVLILGFAVLWIVRFLNRSHTEDQLHQVAPRIIKQREIDALQPTHIKFIRLFANGDLLIGGGPTGLLARVSIEGKTKWTFNAHPEGLEGVYDVTMSGAAVTKNGNIVACGSEFHNRTGTGLIVVLTSDGEEISRRTVASDGPTDLNFCNNFNGKIVVTGNIIPPRSLIMMLDENGAEIWRRIGAVGTLWTPHASETSDEALNVVETTSANTLVYKFDQGGRILSQVPVPGGLPVALISPELAPSLSLITYEGSAMLFRIDEKDHISSSELNNDVGVTVSGSSYLLPDGSVAVFGHSIYEITTAAAARVLKDGETAVTVVGPARKTWELIDAARISPYQFIAIEQVARSPHGVYMLVWLDYPHSEEIGKILIEEERK